MTNYKIDFANKKIIVTKEFQEKMQNVNSAEYELYKKLSVDFPGFVLTLRTHKTPKKYVTKSNETFTHNPQKNLTYKNMEYFISSIGDADNYLTQYNFLKDVAGKLQINAYALVNKWFLAQFPEYRTNPLAYLFDKPEVVKASDILQEVA